MHPAHDLDHGEDYADARTRMALPKSNTESLQTPMWRIRNDTIIRGAASALTLAEFRNLPSERVHRDYLQLVEDVDKYARFALSDSIMMDFILKDMQKRGVTSVQDWKLSMTGTFAEYKKGHKWNHTLSYYLR